MYFPIPTFDGMALAKTSNASRIPFENLFTCVIQEDIPPSDRLGGDSVIGMVVESVASISEHFCHAVEVVIKKMCAQLIRSGWSVFEPDQSSIPKAASAVAAHQSFSFRGLRSFILSLKTSRYDGLCTSNRDSPSQAKLTEACDATATSNPGN
jgi:hypothetical protein